jgi:hypothetical protein
MKNLNMHGALRAYKGATATGRLLGQQTGSSRITSELSMFLPQVTYLRPRTENSKKICTL